MAAAHLNFNEASLDTSSALYQLYIALYNGFVAAGQVDAPDYTTNPPTTETGEIDMSAISSGLSDYTTILTKNSAYLFASSIIGVFSGGGGGGGLDFLSKSGDAMTGQLDALYGFIAGDNGDVIFGVSQNSSGDSFADVYGTLNVDDDLYVGGKLVLDGDNGLYFGNTQILYTDSETGKVYLNSDVVIEGTIEMDSLTIGDVQITEDGIFYGENEYYHTGNSNNEDSDWSMKNGHVYGDLQVDGESEFGDLLTALHGFSLGDNNIPIIYSQYTAGSTARPTIALATDLNILDGYGVKFGDAYIIKVRGGSENVVSFSAPGKVLNLGDSDGTTATTRISLQADMYDASSAYRIISKNGDGNFPNSFSAGCGTAGSTVMQTYYGSATDMGVVFQKNIRLGSASGPSISKDDDALAIGLSYTYVDSSEVPHTTQLPITFEMVGTTSLFHDLTIENSASVKVDTDAEFIVFTKPVEAASFAIASETYKTRLIENALFFNDGIWIEGIEGGMSLHGNATFSGNLGSAQFASGFAGYGWAINENELYGGWEATFDSLTVRKKMRVYELEVQKTSVTNGSLWVSDSCSGDFAEEVN